MRAGTGNEKGADPCEYRAFSCLVEPSGIEPLTS